MTEAEARARIETFLDASVEPVLAPADVQVLLDMARRRDKYGIAPGETGWTQTWDLNYAIAQGWLLKAGRLARHYLFMSGGKMLARNQFYDHCMHQYRVYGSKSSLKASRLGPAQDTGLAGIPLGNWNANR